MMMGREAAADVIIIGGSYAGLSAAMMLARGRRTVLVLDAGQRRNRFAARSHGVLAQDGRPGADIAAAASAQLADYPSVRQIEAAAESIDGTDGQFEVRTADGLSFTGRKVLLATGVTDILPDVPGLAERWGRSVFHCPYCHGYELGSGPIAVLHTGPASIAQAITLADWGHVTLLIPAEALDPVQGVLLARRGVSVETRTVSSLQGSLDGPVRIGLLDGSSIEARGIFIASKQDVSPLAKGLGLVTDETPHGELIQTGADKQTSVPGIYAAGDTARLPSNVTLASADGVIAGAAIHQALISGDLERAA
jgi:thioredoxin reductase